MFNLFAAPPGPFISNPPLANSLLPSLATASQQSLLPSVLSVKIRQQQQHLGTSTLPPHAHVAEKSGIRRSTNSMNRDSYLPFFWDPSPSFRPTATELRPSSLVRPEINGLGLSPFTQLFPSGLPIMATTNLMANPLVPVAASFGVTSLNDVLKNQHAQRLYEEALKDLKVEAMRHICEQQSQGNVPCETQIPPSLLTRHFLQTFGAEYLRLGLQQAIAEANEQHHFLNSTSKSLPVDVTSFKISMPPFSTSEASMLKNSPSSLDAEKKISNVKNVNVGVGGVNHRDHCGGVDTCVAASPADSLHNLQTHRTEHYVCDKCKKSYTTQSGLLKHKEHHCNGRSKQYTCHKCQKVYHSLSALKMHIRTHTLPCHCTICGKAFSRMWLLNGHIRTHTGEKPFQCDICKRAFADRSNLRAHMQTHSEVKRYKCEACTKTFSRMGLLTKHRQGGCALLDQHSNHSNNGTGAGAALSFDFCKIMNPSSSLPNLSNLPNLHKDSTIAGSLNMSFDGDAADDDDDEEMTDEEWNNDTAVE